MGAIHGEFCLFSIHHRRGGRPAARHLSLASARARLTREQADELQPLDARRSSAASAYERTRAAAALAELGQVEREIAVARQLTDIATSRLERELQDLSDPAIDAAIERLEQRQSECRVQYRKSKSNRSGLRLISEAISIARDQLRDLKLFAVEDLATVIRGIESEIPWGAADEFDWEG